MIPRVMMLLVLLATGALLTAGCTTLPDTCIEGSGVPASETRDVGDFHSVSLALPASLIVREGHVPGLLIEADDNILPFISTTVKDGVLTITQTRPCVRPTGTIRITTTSPDFRELAILGTGDIRSDGILRTPGLAAKITGAGDLDLAVETVTLSTTVTGTGNVRLSGTAHEHTITLPGAGSVDAAALQTARTSVEILGSGNAKVNASETLSVKITGAGTVLYAGNPQVEQTITGAGSVRRMA
ncbi:MAG: DUF2807 domain-containing protein [Methanomicrobiales archaeon]|nr:DUF2807 domain-containing protein [Methanomicrobiales archaeon]